MYRIKTFKDSNGIYYIALYFNCILLFCFNVETDLNGPPYCTNYILCMWFRRFTSPIAKAQKLLLMHFQISHKKLLREKHKFMCVIQQCIYSHRNVPHYIHIPYLPITNYTRSGSREGQRIYYRKKQSLEMKQNRLRKTFYNCEVLYYVAIKNFSGQDFPKYY